MGEYVNPSNREFASAGPDPYQNQCHVIFLNMQTFLSNSGNAEELRRIFEEPASGWNQL